jgi:hypothetical protein
MQKIQRRSYAARSFMIGRDRALNHHSEYLSTLGNGELVHVFRIDQTP